MKRKLIFLAAAAAVAATAAGGSLAALNTTTENNAGAATTGISLKDIGISVANATGTVGGDVATNPGGEWDNATSFVTNTMTGGYTVYTKVVIDHRFDDLDSDMAFAYIGDSYETGTVLDEDAETVNDWIVFYADDEQTVMYYTKPLAPGESTTDFLDGIYFSPEMGNDYAGASYSVDITVTAVQYDNGYGAIASELGVFPTFDEDGNITAVSERR